MMKGKTLSRECKALIGQLAISDVGTATICFVKSSFDLLQGGATKKELCQSASITRQGARRHLECLKRLGYISREKLHWKLKPISEIVADQDFSALLTGDTFYYGKGTKSLFQ